MYELIFKILNMSITATFMALAVIIMRLILKRAPKWISYALWGVVLFRLVCPLSFSSAFSLLSGIGAPAAESGIVSYIPENIVHTAQQQVNLVIPDVNEAINGALPQGEEQLVADPLEAPAAIATFLWLLGVAVMLVYSVVSYALLKRRLSDATLLYDNVFETDAIPSPFVCGLTKPRIYLPFGLPEAELGYVLLHERIHIRRKDYLIKPMAFLALSVHWFNPVMWLSFRLMSRDMEMSCDERVARELDPEGRAGYSAALLRLATGRPILTGSPLAFGESGAKGRIRNILNYKRPAFRVIAIAVIACIAAAVFLLANPAKRLELPDAASVLSVRMEQFNEYESLGSAVVTDSGDIESILSSLTGAGKTLRRPVNDYPTKNNYLIVRLILKDETRTLCLYSEGSRYLIEEPYVGVYGSSRAASVAVYKVYAASGIVHAISAAYAFEKCLYVNPSTSYYPMDGTGQLYLCRPGSFTIVSEETGEIQKNYSLIDWKAKEVDPGGWNGMLRDNVVDISGYQSRIEYDIGGDYRLYQMDDEVWLGQFSRNMLLRLYQLQETDFSLSDITGRTGPFIPENETLRVDSPDGAYAAEAYGTNKGITAAGLYPYEGLRVIRNSDERTVWNTDGYYRAEFLWSSDSKYVAVYREARIYGECFVVAAETGKVIELPGLQTLSTYYGTEGQPDSDRPDPYFKAMEWVDGTTLHVSYRWIAQEGSREVSGTYEFNIISGDIVAKTSQINDAPG